MAAQGLIIPCDEAEVFVVHVKCRRGGEGEGEGEGGGGVVIVGRDSRDYLSIV